MPQNESRIHFSFPAGSCLSPCAMRKTALLFAGQGAQIVGMGHDLAQVHLTAKTLFQQAQEILGYDLQRLCFQGPESELTQTEHAQPAIYLVGWIAFELLREQFPALEFHATAGLSLGEFTALAAAEVFTFEDGLRLVRQRGLAMQQACAQTQGAMAAIIGLDEAPTREVCAEAGVALANLNCPGQIVISGAVELIERACDLARARGAKKALPLPVAGAYHSPLMASAQARLAQDLNQVTLKAPSVPVVSNVTAEPHGAPETDLGPTHRAGHFTGALGSRDPPSPQPGLHAIHRTRTGQSAHRLPAPHRSQRGVPECRRSPQP